MSINADILEPGEVRRFKKPSTEKAYGGPIIVLEVHDEPRESWTNEPTCLVRQGKQAPNVATQRVILELSVPMTEEKDGVEVKQMQSGTLL